MIKIEQEGDCLAVAVVGDFSLADFREFESQALYQIRFRGALRLLLDFRLMQSYSIDVVWHELNFVREHLQSFDRVVIVTENQWMTWSGWISNLFIDSDVATFADINLARAWLHRGQ